MLSPLSLALGSSILDRTGAALFEGQYHIGFITADIKAAQVRLAERYGIKRFRVKRNPESIWSAHAFAGEMMIEVVQPGPQAPAIYLEDRPGGGAIRLHHLGYWIRDLNRFREVEETLARGGWKTPHRGEAMDGNLRFIFVDMRADLGHYREYVFLSGPALELYHDVPLN